VKLHAWPELGIRGERSSLETTRPKYPFRLVANPEMAWANEKPLPKCIEWGFEAKGESVVQLNRRFAPSNASNCPFSFNPYRFAPLSKLMNDFARVQEQGINAARHRHCQLDDPGRRS